MVFKLSLIQQSQHFLTLLKLSKRATMNQNKIYFRYVQSEEQIDINFLFRIKEQTLRQFNLTRKSSEPLSVVVTRISTNVQKFINKASKKKVKDNTVQNEIASFVDAHGVSLPDNLSCADLFQIKNGVKLQLLDNTLEAVFNPPWVLNISLPKSILAEFPVYPEYFSSQFTDEKYNTFNWYVGEVKNEKGNEISEIHIQWVLSGTGITYVPTSSDVGKKLKLECIPGNASVQGPSVDTISQSVIEAGPGYCPFQARHCFTSEKLRGKSFRCVSYNILADLYCDSDFTRTVLHPYCPPYALHIDYRKHLIMKELLGYNADIMCLQEVDRKVFQNCLQPILQANGLEGLFYKKGKEVAEGLSCFYRTDRFRKVSEEHIVLSNKLKTDKCFETIWNGVKNNSPLLERLLDRSTVCSASLLESLDNPNQLLLVGNTHLYFHPNADHIRLVQGGMFIYWLKKILEEFKEKMPEKNISLVLCGDFNSVPSCGIYQLYTSGCAPNDLPDWKSCDTEAINNLTLSQDIPLRSACGTPEYTNFTADFADCLDYIYYDSTSLAVEQVVPFPAAEELQTHTALPSIVFPSDHIALIADLTFKK